MTDRAVSDVMGYVLAFSLVLSTVAVVYTVGMGSLRETRQDRQIDNAERAFDILANNVADMALEGAPSRATEVKLGPDATLRFLDPVTVNVSGRPVGAPNTTFWTGDVSLRPVAYGAGGPSRVVYAFGAVLRARDGNAAMIRDPPIAVRESMLVVPFIQTRQAGRASISTGETVLVRTEQGSPGVMIQQTNGPYNVTVNVSSPRAGAWRRYFQDELGATCPAALNDGSTAVCRVVGPERVVANLARVDVYLLP